MPCTYDESPEEAARRTASQHKEELDYVTDMLCRILTYTEDKLMSAVPVLQDRVVHQNLMALHPGLPKFWSDHKAKDTKRKELEAAKAEVKRLSALIKTLGG